ncbi:MAG: alpha/beta fold hydrolase [Alphaproteobacteria bacterium]|nr:alpha/beta fold hydrolase [Alphaproteobacteria bacterium]
MVDAVTWRERRFMPGLRAALHVAVLALSGCSIPGPSADDAAIEAMPTQFAEPEGLSYPIAYVEAGDPEGQSVLFVHGTPGEKEAWADYLLHVPEGLHYIAIDRPGFGESGPEGAVPDLKEQASALSPWLMAKDGPPVILVGHSLGGPIIARAAIDYPGRVAALVIVAGSLDPALEEVMWVQYMGDWSVISWALPRPIRNANRELIPLEGDLAAMEPLLSEITVPVIIVHGTEDDLVPYANVSFMEKMMTSASPMEVRTLTGQNHFLPWNAKSEIDAAIREAVARVTGQP